MSHADTILDLIRRAPGLTDAEIHRRTGIGPHQQVNQVCRRLEAWSLIRREAGQDGRILNLPAETESLQLHSAARQQAHATPSLPRAPDSSEWVLEEVATTDPLQAVTVLPCSGDKRHGGDDIREASLPDLLPTAIATGLREARERVAGRARRDESRLLPAWQRYCGRLYQAAGPHLKRVLGEGGRVLILSGGYGVALAEDPIGWYDAVFRRSWWPGAIVEAALAYVHGRAVTTVVAFAARTTDYAKIVRSTRWSEAGAANAYLVSPVLEGRGGGQGLVPRALGEAAATFWQRRLKRGWRSSNGLALHAARLR